MNNPNKSIGWKPALFVAIPVLLAVLTFFTTLSLGWKDQAILGALLITLAVGINRFFKGHLTTLFLTLMACFCTARYAYYRYSETYWNLNTSWTQTATLDIIFVLLLLLAESYSFFILFLGCFQTARPLKRKPVAMPEDTSLWPNVDVFIPTYNEPLDVVVPTVLAALTMDWPADKFRVFILDDGRRASFEQFAAECGATYVTRLDNAHAKAGNINHALRKTSGEYVAIFDCDHIPTRSFLQMTMGGFLHNSQLSMVQTPHHFYSPDPFERNLDIFRDVPNESALFYGIIQDGNDLWDATFFCGSCAVIRRTALEEIGGIAVETVTEDAHTALRMHSNGWSTSYINIPQAGGLATSRLADHIGQRIRWARGMVQILRVDNPIFKRGLKLPQRLCYLNSMSHYLFAWPRLIFLLSPLVYLIFGRSNVFGYLPGILAHGLPHLVLATMINSRIQGKVRHSFWNEVYEIVLTPYILLPTLLALINPKWGKFNVTAKESMVEGSYFDWQIAKPFGVLLLVNLVGLALGFHHMWTDGDPQGVLAVNLTWAGFNTLTLGAALAVAHESRQIRSSVRVPAKLPLQLILANGSTVSGSTQNLSFGGIEAQLVRSGMLAPNQTAQIEINLSGEVYKLPAKVVETSGSQVRLTFGHIDRIQHAMLTRLIFGRADCWVNWSSSYAADKPLMNLFRIFKLSMRGMSAGLIGLFPKSKPSRANESEGLRSAILDQTAMPILALLLLLGCACNALAEPVAASKISVATTDAWSKEVVAESAKASPSFRDVHELSSLGHKQGASLRGDGSRFSVYFGMPITKMVLDGALAFRYRAAPASSGRINVVLNGSPQGFVTIEANPNPLKIQQAVVALSPELFLAENNLTLEYKRACGADCPQVDESELWVAIESSTEVRTSGTLLPMPNRLDLLPAPFVGPSSQRVVDVPFVLDKDVPTLTLQAAGVAASWFGIKADHQAIRFPVSTGKIPPGNVVLLATKGSALAYSLGVDASATSVSIRNNPNDPYGKVLAIVAPDERKLLEAARAFALERYAREGESSLLSASEMPASRIPYDAPRWLNTDHSVRLAEAASDADLQVTGSGSVNLYFRLPPDLYYGTHDTVPFHLKYRCSLLAQGSKAMVNLLLNGRLVATRQIATDVPTDIHEEILYLPVSAIYPRNTLAIEFSFERVRFPDGGSRLPVASVLRSSELMVKGMPHFSPMPQLDMFANTGFPFTRLADLSETLVVLPSTPQVEDITLYLNMLGFMGAQTGYPALRVSVSRGKDVPLTENKDFLMIGAIDKQPLLRECANQLTLQPEGDHFRIRDAYGIGSLLSKLPWLEASKERRILNLLLQSEAPIDGIVQGFESPVRPERSVLAITGLPGRRLTTMADDWASVANAAHVYGTVSVLTGGEFHSFSIREAQYHVGSLDETSALQYWGRRFYWLSPVLILACIFLLTLFWNRTLEARAAARLELRHS